jgi:hypothetical protein
MTGNNRTRRRLANGLAATAAAALLVAPAAGARTNATSPDPDGWYRYSLPHTNAERTQPGTRPRHRPARPRPRTANPAAWLVLHH